MRYAGTYWIEVQAKCAAARAMAIDAEPIQELIDCDLSGTPSDVVAHGALLESWRQTALADAARSLLRAELLHRMMVRRGGRK